MEKHKGNRFKLVLGLLLAIAFGWISLHSVWEIHYLKTFYTGSFTVEEVALATAVELVKVLLSIAPFLFGYWVIDNHM